MTESLELFEGVCSLECFRCARKLACTCGRRACAACAHSGAFRLRRELSACALAVGAPGERVAGSIRKKKDTRACTCALAHRNTEIVLLLNKWDLFQEKVRD